MPHSNTLTILIIDDDPGTRSSLRRILKQDGYAIEEADSVASALARDNWDVYFAILLDLRLPDGTSDDLLPQLTQLAPTASILIITGNADIESSISALRAGVADYLLKPVEPESVRLRLRALADLRVARSEIAQRDAQLEFMVEHLPGAAAYVDCKTEAVRFNGIVADITGYAVEELTTLDACFSRFFGDKAAAVRRQYNDRKENWGNEPSRLTIKCKNGAERIVEFRGYRYDAHEVWLIHDVTERDRHETELRIRDRAIQAANEGVVIADATSDGYPIVFVNQAFESLSGYSAQEALGKGYELLCGNSTDQDSISDLKSAIAAAHDFHTTIQCTRKNGETFWNELSIAPVRSGIGHVTHIVAVMEDVSERRAAQQQLMQSERLAAIGEVVTGLAHESRNALQRAQACLDMLSLDLEEHPEQLELTEKTRRALKDLHQHYEEVRNYAAPINLNRRPTDLKKVWTRTWNNLEASWFGRDFKLVQIDGPERPVCNVDEHRIEQVFRNIMENAIAACDQDPGTLTVSWSHARIANKDCVSISFLDNGPGFDPSAAAGVFRAFFTTKQKGTGLGMAIAKRIVDAHGGHIAVAQPVSGAEIIVTLPR